ncbi:hypothetical protein C8J57DRAFT_1246730 [Mycena rebaudengoi]|nr:hypothetical protein C8J57DRAFT_1246730 [Mycena rebaudengoi]
MPESSPLVHSVFSGSAPAGSVLMLCKTGKGNKKKVRAYRSRPTLKRRVPSSNQKLRLWAVPDAVSSDDLRDPAIVAKTNKRDVDVCPSYTQSTPPTVQHVAPSWSRIAGHMSRKAGHSFLNAGFQPITQWVQAGASSEWWPAELQAGLHRTTHLYYILSRIVGLLNLVIVAALTPEPSPAPEAAAFASITSSTSCWNPSTVSSSWKRTSREIVADWLRWSTGGTRILRVCTKNKGSRYNCESRHGERGGSVGGRRDVWGGLGESAGEVKLREEDTKRELRVKTLETARNDETMLLGPGLGAFAEDEGKEHADTEEEERTNEMISTCPIMWVPYGFIWMPAGGRLEFRLQRKAGYQLETLWDQLLKNVDISWAVQLEAACRHFGGVPLGHSWEDDY